MAGQDCSSLGDAILLPVAIASHKEMQDLSLPVCATSPPPLLPVLPRIDSNMVDFSPFHMVCLLTPMSSNACYEWLFMAAIVPTNWSLKMVLLQMKNLQTPQQIVRC